MAADPIPAADSAGHGATQLLNRKMLLDLRDLCALS